MERQRANLNIFDGTAFVLGAIHKGRPLKIETFYPLSPCPSYDVTVATQMSSLCPFLVANWILKVGLLILSNRRRR